MAQVTARAVIADQWYRLDKSDGSLLAVNAVNVMRAAQGSYSKALDVIKSGRFSTSFAIYSKGSNLSEDERVIR